MNEYPLLRGSELMGMAIQVEDQGIDFYRSCLKLRSPVDPRVKEVFDFLIAQERLHRDIFEDMQRNINEDYPLDESYPGEMRSYIDTFISGRVFMDPAAAKKELDRMTGSAEGPLIAIDFGVNFEQRSILFYSAMHGVVRLSEQKVVDQVVEAEHQHIKTLLRLRRQLTGNAAAGPQTN